MALYSINGEKDASSQPPIAIGASIGRFTLKKELSRSAMSIVYQAHDPELERNVAVKIQRTSSDLDAEGEERLRREGQSLARLTHNNIVSVYESGMHGKRVYVVMEYIDGINFDVWLKTQQRSTPEIIDIFLKAGNGLQAAHRAQLLHRDFKPANIMIADDAVKVTDFGLVQSVSEYRTTTMGEDDVEITHLSMSGGIIGNPMYMAPELLAGKHATLYSDQYAFCVALFEALHGRLPFQGKTVKELQAHKNSGVLPKSPHGIAVPTWMIQVIRRGLHPNPKKRFSSMEELLSRLTHDPFVAKRRAGLALLGVAVTAAIFLSGYRLMRTDTVLCTGAHEQIHAIWNQTTKETIRNLILTPKMTFARETWERVERSLNTFTSDWTSAYIDACEATTVHKEQSTRLLDLRMACLETKFREFQAIVGVMQTLKPEAISSTIQTVGVLDSVASCSDIRELQLGAPLPSDKNLRKQIAAIEKTSQEVTALLQTGDYLQALTKAESIAAQTEALRYRPIQASALEKLGHAYIAVDRFHDAQNAYKDGLLAAIAGGDHRREAALLIALTLLHGTDMAQFEQANDYADRMLAMTERLGSIPMIEIETRHAIGASLYIQGKLEEAEVQINTGLSVLKSMGSADRFDTKLLHSLYLDVSAGIHAAKFNHRKAIELQQKALTIEEELFGLDHPRIAPKLEKIAALHVRLDENEKARILLRRTAVIRDGATGSGNEFSLLYYSAEIEEDPRKRHQKLTAARQAAVELYGEVHPITGNIWGAIGETEMELDRVQDAQTSLERSLKILRALFAPDQLQLFFSLWYLSQAQSALGDSASALQSAKQAIVATESHREDQGPLALSQMRLAEVYIDQAQWPLVLPPLAVAEAIFKEKGDIFGDSWMWQINFMQTISRWHLGENRKAQYRDAQQIRSAYAKLPDANPDKVAEMNQWISKIQH